MASRWTGTGLVVVISSPSGGGKSTVIRELRKRHKEFLFSVSATTRARRRGERNGTHYRFLTQSEFKQMRTSKKLAEWASVHDQFYGTPKANLQEAYRKRRVMLCDLDVQGAASLRRSDRSVVTIFLKPPSWDVLRKRLTGRGSESAAQLRRRLQTARLEMKRVTDYEFVVTNDRLEQCVSDCESIIRAEILRQHPAQN
jgi:guanylate kinase